MEVWASFPGCVVKMSITPSSENYLRWGISEWYYCYGDLTLTLVHCKRLIDACLN